MKLMRCNSRADVARCAAQHGADIIRNAIHERGGANIIVATGASQFETIAALVAIPDIRWDLVTAFHLDEYVGLDITHPASFRLYLWKRFRSQLPLPLAAFYDLNGMRPPEEEAARVGRLLLQHPTDIAFVGIGENGHMAFNDPPADFDTHDPYIVVELDDRCRQQQCGEGWFNSVDEVPRRAISMSIHQILQSHVIVASVPDARKAEAVKNSVVNEVNSHHPSTCLQRHNNAFVYLDPDSSSLLSSATEILVSSRSTVAAT